MLRFTKFCTAVAALALVFIFIVPAVSFSTTVEAEAAASINVTKVVLKPGKTKKITVEGDGTGFTWTSSNTAVAKVTRKVKADNSATITAKGEGVAVITATKGKNTYTCSVVVMDTVDTKAPEGEKATTSKSFKDITVFEKEGTVSVTRSKKSLSATKNMKLKNSDFVSVDDDSYLRLCMDDKSYTYFEAGSEFAISKGWFSKIKVCMTQGEMIVEVQKKLGSDESIDLVTPNTCMSIRGTVAAVKTIPGKDGKTTTINYVLEGSAEVTYKDKKTKEDKVVTLKAGEGWETTTNKKGKVVENKKADASKFDFENIDISKLQGADGEKLIVNGKDIPDNTETDTKEGSNSGSETGSDVSGTDAEGSGSGEDTGNENGDEQTAAEPVFVKAVPAVFDFDKSSIQIVDEKEEFPNDNTMVLKEYDIFGVLRHKTQSIESFNEPSQDKTSNFESREYSYADWYYDSNRTLRIYRTERMVYTFGASANNEPNDHETSYVTEIYYNSAGIKIFEDVTDETYETTTWYTDEGKIAEYMRITIADSKEVEHIYYAYDQDGNRKTVE